MVLALLTKLLMTKQLRFEDGVVELKDSYLTILPSFFISELTQLYHRTNRLPVMYLLSWIAGYLFVYRVKKEFNLRTPEEIYSFGMDLTEFMGIGLYKTHDYYPGKYTHFIIRNNPFIKYITPKSSTGLKEPVDYFIAGSMAGGGSHVHNDICQTIELKCLALNHPYCEFITGTETELRNRKLWSIAEKRYNLKKLYPLQKLVFENYSGNNETELLKAVLDGIETIYT